MHTYSTNSSQVHRQIERHLSFRLPTIYLFTIHYCSKFQRLVEIVVSDILRVSRKGSDNYVGASIQWAHPSSPPSRESQNPFTPENHDYFLLVFTRHNLLTEQITISAE